MNYYDESNYRVSPFIIRLICFLAVLFLVIAKIAEAQVTQAPFYTQQINNNLYVGFTSGYPTIAKAMAFACKAPAKSYRVIVPTGAASTTESIASVTTGCSTAYLVDERAVPYSTAYTWNGTSWTAAASGMVYPGAGISVSTGSAWGTSINPARLAYLDTAANFTAGLNSGGSPVCTTATGCGATMVYPGAGLAQSSGSAWLPSLDPATLPRLAASNTFTGTNTFGAVAATSLNVAGSPACTVATGCGGSGGMIYPAAGVPVSSGSAWGTSIPAANFAYVNADAVNSYDRTSSNLFNGTNVFGPTSNTNFQNLSNQTLTMMPTSPANIAMTSARGITATASITSSMAPILNFSNSYWYNGAAVTDSWTEGPIPPGGATNATITKSAYGITHTTNTLPGEFDINVPFVAPTITGTTIINAQTLAITNTVYGTGSTCSPNNLTTGGTYFLDNCTGTGLPPATDKRGFTMQVYSTAQYSPNIIQIAYNFNTQGEVWMRANFFGNWQTWYKFTTTAVSGTQEIPTQTSPSRRAKGYCKVGEMWVDGGFMYGCSEANTPMRVQLQAFEGTHAVAEARAKRLEARKARRRTLYGRDDKRKAHKN